MMGSSRRHGRVSGPNRAGTGRCRPQHWLALFVALFLLLSACGTDAEMDEAYTGTPLDGEAPGFVLTDHRGDPVELQAFRGRVVALSFLDTKCLDVCPLTALHIHAANEALGERAGSVAWIGVNVNLDAATLDDVREATEEWQLQDLASWHFLTGTEEELRPVWKAYSVLAEKAEDHGGLLVHTPGVFLIDQTGQKRWYVSTPLQSAEWTGPALSELLESRISELLGEGS